MPKFQKKPVVIDAVHYTGENEEEVLEFTDSGADLDANSQLIIHTLEGNLHVSPGDWVIRGVQGEYYPCKPDIFEATYEPVGQDDIQSE